MTAVLATAQAVLTIPGTQAQKLHPPAVTLGAWYITLTAFIAAALPIVASLAGLQNPLTTIFGAHTASVIVACGQIAAAIVGSRSAHIAATGRSIVPAVDNPPTVPAQAGQAATTVSQPDVGTVADRKTNP